MKKSLLLSTSVLIAGLLILSAQGVFADNDRETITICHADHSDKKPYVVHHPATSGDVSGHDDHDGPVWSEGAEEWGDIIPPFTYNDGDTNDGDEDNNPVDPEQYPGKNWTTEGQEIYENSCAVPGETPPGDDDDDPPPGDDDDPPPAPECSDDADNDDAEDELVDENDPGCWTDPNDPGTYDPQDNDETYVPPTGDDDDTPPGDDDDTPPPPGDDDTPEETSDDDDGGGSSGSHRRSSDGDGEVAGVSTSRDGEVLEAHQTAVVPLGAPLTGGGAMGYIPW